MAITHHRFRLENLPRRSNTLRGVFNGAHTSIETNVPSSARVTVNSPMIASVLSGP